MVALVRTRARLHSLASKRLDARRSTDLTRSRPSTRQQDIPNVSTKVVHCQTIFTWRFTMRFSILLAVITLVAFSAWLLPDPVASAQSCGGAAAVSSCSGLAAESSCSGSAALARSSLASRFRSRLAERRNVRIAKRAAVRASTSCSGVQSTMTVGCGG